MQQAPDIEISGACLVKKATTGYTGGREEFHLWMEKENLR